MSKSKQVLALADLNLGHRRPITPAMSRQNQNFAAVGQAWAATPHASRSAWQLLANQMTHETGLRTAAGLKQKRAMNAYQAFSSVNATRLAVGLSVLTDAPSAPDKPNALPPVLLQAAVIGSADGNDDAATALGFTLTLSTPPYDDMVQVYASAPLLAGQYPAGQNAFVIATLTDVGGVQNLTDAYTARFGPLSVGQQVLLTLVPVSSSGFHGVPLSLAADVTAHAAQRTGDAPALKAA